MERRIQAEKRERYLASAEYAELMAKQTKEEQNIAISKAAQISDKDVSLAKQSTSDAADASARKWIGAVLEVPLDPEMSTQAVLKTGGEQDTLLSPMMSKSSCPHVLTSSVMPRTRSLDTHGCRSCSSLCPSAALLNRRTNCWCSAALQLAQRDPSRDGQSEGLEVADALPAA